MERPKEQMGSRGCPASQANSRRFWDSLHQQGLFCQRFGILPFLTFMFCRSSLAGCMTESTEQYFVSHQQVPAAARVSSTLTNYFAPSSAFKPLSPALFLIIAGQTKLKPVVWLPVCLTLCGREGVTSLCRLGQSCLALQDLVWQPASTGVLAASFSAARKHPVSASPPTKVRRCPLQFL